MGFLIGDFELDTARELLIGPQGPVPLRRQAYRLLLLLAEQAPALVPRDTLIDTLWGHQALSPNVLPQTLSELRQALGDDPQQPKYIATRHRRGYVLVAPVRRLERGASPRSPNAATPPPMAGGRLLLAVDVDDAGLLAGLRLRAAAATSWALLDRQPAASCHAGVYNATATGTDAKANGAGDALASVPISAPGPWPGPQGGAWHLTVDRFGQWQLQSADGQRHGEGRLPLQDRSAWAATLLQAVASATGHRSPANEPTGWPADASARPHLAAWALARAQGHPAAALGALDHLAALAPLAGWPLFWRAEAQAEAGDFRGAAATLAGLGRELEPKLALQAEALRSRLAGLPNESLAALRAGALLVPEDTAARLAVLDAQLAQAQWAAAADALAPLTSMLGADDTRLLLRQARWCAAIKPLQADAAFKAAVARADQLVRDQDRHPAQQQARTAYAHWLLERSRFDDAAAQLAALPHDDPEALLLQAWLAREQGRVPASQQAGAAAVAGFMAWGRLADARRARLNLAEVALRTGDPRSAASLAQSQLDEAVQHDDRLQQGDWLAVLGRAQAAQAQFEPARAALQQAIDLARSHGDPRRAAMARYHLGATFALERQRPQEAEHAFRMAAEVFRSLNDDLWEVKCLANLALMAERAGRRLDARAAYQDALVRLRDLGVPQELGRIGFNAGVNERELGDLNAAATHLDAALAALPQVAAVDIWTMAAAARADLALAQADVAQANAALQAVAAARQRAAAIPRSCWCTAMARVADLAGRVGEANAWLDEAIALRSQAGVRTALIDAELRRICLHLNTPAAATEAAWPLQRMAAELQRLGEAKFALWPGLTAVAAQLVAGDVAAARAQAEALSATVHAQGNRLQQLQLEWLLALASLSAERTARLQAVVADAQAAGYHLLGQLARLELAPPGSATHHGLTAHFADQALAGALRSAAGIL